MAKLLLDDELKPISELLALACSRLEEEESWDDVLDVRLDELTTTAGMLLDEYELTPVLLVTTTAGVLLATLAITLLLKLTDELLALLGNALEEDDSEAALLNEARLDDELLNNELLNNELRADELIIALLLDDEDTLGNELLDEKRLEDELAARLVAELLELETLLDTELLTEVAVLEADEILTRDEDDELAGR